jgi:site-specific DNA-methyltransferase (adenine-specific)
MASVMHERSIKNGIQNLMLPEDTQKRKKHYAAYPEDLCKIPILATCPKDGIVLDPFAGTGTTMVV